MYLCLRVDLDYVPWDTPDATEYGHGEPATLLRLLDLARSLGLKYHFFASERVVRAFPASVSAVLNEGHDLDWLCKHPEELEARYTEALRLFTGFGNPPQGLALRTAWPEDLQVKVPKNLKFLSAHPGLAPKGLRLFPVETRPERDALRAGQTVSAWTDGVKTHFRQVAMVGTGATICVRPQVLAKIDAHLKHFKDMVRFGMDLDLKNRTLREVYVEGVDS